MIIPSKLSFESSVASNTFNSRWVSDKDGFIEVELIVFPYFLVEEFGVYDK